MNFKEIIYMDRKTKELLKEDVPGESFLKFLYYNPLGILPLELIVKRKFLSSFYGKQMDSKKSKEKIKPFVENYKINMEESTKSIDEFNSFNDFFYRTLKENARPIDSNEKFLSSPADGKILVFEDLKNISKFFVKGEAFSLEEYLQDPQLAKKYQDGTLVLIRLAPVDYHRFHFPANGIVSETKKIDGFYYSVSPYAIRKNFRVFCENKREYCVLETKEFGNVILSEIGATMVGSIEQTYKPNTAIKKGQEKGYFLFGGSSCILLFEKNKIKIDSDILENSKKGIETKISMGEKIGEAF